VIALNFDVDGGVVNGSTGTLASIRYTVDDTGARHATSVIVNMDGGYNGAVFPDLPNGHVPVVQDTRFPSNPHSP